MNVSANHERAVAAGAIDPLELADARARVRLDVLGRASEPLCCGRYRLVHKLGEGGMGVVWLADDPVLRRTVAIKLARAGVGVEQRSLALREARALAAVSHPNVLPVYEVGEAFERTYLVMQHVPGITLRTWLAQCPRAKNEIVRVFLAAAAGLTALHRAGLVHRDFKPDNVLLTPAAAHGEIRVLVCDLGLAAIDRNTSGASSASRIAGTPAFMAPEQLRGVAVDARADQYSFCIAMYDALFGTHPFVDDTTLDAAGPESREDPGRKHGAIAQVLRRGLADAPSQRWPDMVALTRALHRATRPRRWPWAFAALLVAVLPLAATAHEPATPVVVPAIDASEPTPIGSQDELLAEVDRAVAEGRLGDALRDGERAYWNAIELGDDASATAAAVEVFDLRDRFELDPDGTDGWEQRARTALARNDEELLHQVRFLVTVGRRRTRENRYDEARAAFLALDDLATPEFHGAMVMHAAKLDGLSRIAFDRGDHREAQRLATEEAEVLGEYFGRDAPERGKTLMWQANCAALAGDVATAETALAEARTILEASELDDGWKIEAATTEARIQQSHGDVRGALATTQGALAQLLRNRPDERLFAAELRVAIADRHWRLGELEAARAQLHAAIVDLETTDAIDQLAETVHVLADLEHDMGELRSAVGRYRRAAELLTQVVPIDDPRQVLLRAEWVACAAKIR
jgi:tetratricopeptide (TPR) repeat protein